MPLRLTAFAFASQQSTSVILSIFDHSNSLLLHTHTIFVSRFDLDKRYNESDKNTSCTPTMSTIVSICVLHFIGSFYKCCSVCALVSSKSCVHCPIAHWTIPINLITYLSGNEAFNSNKKSNECVQVRLQKDTNVEYGYRMCAKE